MYTSTFFSVCNKHEHNLNCDLSRSLVDRSCLRNRLGSRLRSSLGQILLLRLASRTARLHNKSDNHNDQADNEDTDSNVNEGEVRRHLAVRLGQSPLGSVLSFHHLALTPHRTLIAIGAQELALVSHLLAFEILSRSALIITDHNRNSGRSSKRSGNTRVHHSIHSDRLH